MSKISPWLWMSYRFWIVFIVTMTLFDLSKDSSYLAELFKVIIFAGLPGAIFWAITGRKPWAK